MQCSSSSSACSVVIVVVVVVVVHAVHYLYSSHGPLDVKAPMFALNCTAYGRGTRRASLEWFNCNVKLNVLIAANVFFNKAAPR